MTGVNSHKLMDIVNDLGRSLTDHEMTILIVDKL